MPCWLGRQGQESSRELPCYTGSQHRPSRQRPQLHATTILPRSAGVDPARPARPSLPQHRPGAVRPAPAQRSCTPTDRSARGTAVQGTSGRPFGTNNSTGPNRPSSTAATGAGPEAGSSVCGSAPMQLAAAADSTGAVRPTPMDSAGAAASAGRAAVVPWQSGVPVRPDHSSLQRGSNGNKQSRHPSGRGPAVDAGKEAVQTEQAKAEFVELEEAEIEWDAEDVAAVTRHSRTGGATHRADRHSSPDNGDEKTCDGHVWRRPSGTAPAACLPDPLCCHSIYVVEVAYAHKGVVKHFRAATLSDNGRSCRREVSRACKLCCRVFMRSCLPPCGTAEAEQCSRGEGQA